MGVGATGWVPNTTIVQERFKGNRGLAMGIISSGVGIGILVCVPLFQFLIIRLGWRMTYRIMAFFIPLVISAMVALFLRHPSPSILLQNGNTPLPTKMRNSIIIDKRWRPRSWTVQQAVGTRQLWCLSLSFFLGAFVIHSILTHHVAFLLIRPGEKYWVFHRGYAWCRRCRW